MKTHKEKNESCCANKDTPVTSSRDPVCGMNVADEGNSLSYKHQGMDYFFCSSHCLKAFKTNPVAYLNDQGKASKEFSKNRPVFFGTLGVGVLLLVFFGIVTIANGSVDSAFQEFKRIWYWILILASGFGFQLGLFTYLKQRTAEKTTIATADVAASGTVSTGSMVACCAHGLVNVLPLVGISAAAAFLATYQLPLILIGVFSNLVGITIMLGIIQKHGLLPHNAFGQYVAAHSMSKFRNGMIAIGVLVVALTFFSTAAQSATHAGGGGQDTVISLKTQTDNQKMVKVKVTPQKIRFDELLDGLEREIRDMAATNGNEVPYSEFVSRGGSADFTEMVSRSYLGSFLISQGRVGMVANGSDLKLVPGVSVEAERTQTLAIILRRLGGT